jgi:hypothetical protein
MVVFDSQIDYPVWVTPYFLYKIGITLEWRNFLDWPKLWPMRSHYCLLSDIWAD